MTRRASLPAASRAGNQLPNGARRRRSTDSSTASQPVASDADHKVVPGRPPRDAPPDAPKACQARKNPPSYEVGYGRPPKSTQWQKGQCGNPKRIRNKNPKPVVDMIDEFFAGEIDIKENGISRRVSHFEAIVLQLWIKVMDGKKRAMNVLLQYQAFAARRSGGMGGVQVEVVCEGASPEQSGSDNV